MAGVACDPQNFLSKIDEQVEASSVGDSRSFVQVSRHQWTTPKKMTMVPSQEKASDIESDQLTYNEQSMVEEVSPTFI